MLKLRWKKTEKRAGVRGKWNKPELLCISTFFNEFFPIKRCKI